ncbi:hypothetical protein QBC37DRAFT_283736 [Rhypophila decipiens]|uniref:RING-CH-type domain-containing protein n=1 Tax=Rhypophila decipiens TaxID=261697 RepID=A0AAN7B8Y8_9PEZI|nr:hypothetical protein QBC37DRAFT_283736 [Rhypophila decipiens]
MGAQAAENAGPPEPSPWIPPPSSSSPPDNADTQQAESPKQETPPAQGRQRYYRPRTCRICLEEVQPTTEIDDSIAGRMFQSKTRVRYVSEDPELGRLMSPCKCKGSQKYVHEGCLQAWRRAQPLADRNFWKCPTCSFEYRMERLRWSQWLSSRLLRVAITIMILVVTVFVLGFIADPIIKLWLDPFFFVDSVFYDDEDDYHVPVAGLVDDEPNSWSFHFFKGFASLGLLGFFKSFFVTSPWRWFGGVRVGGGRRRGTARDRVESVNMIVIVLGVVTFLGATWKVVTHYTSVALEKFSDRVADVQGDDDDDEDEDAAGAPAPAPPQESRKDRSKSTVAMHFAYPPRKSSNPQPYLPRGSKLPALRKSRLKVIALGGLAFFTIIWIIIRASGSRAPTRHKPNGNPPAVIVTVLDEKKYSKGYIDTIKENRMQYAEKHGYQTFFPSAEDYDLKKAPASWASVVASRHALTKYPDAYFVWFLDQNSFIMNPSLKIEQDIMAPAKIESLMKKDQPVVPPDSIIKTFSHLRGGDVDFVLTQDKEGLSVGSFIVRNGEWGEFMLETWFDPIYRSYNFQRAETHALEHIVQWHPTILAKMAIVDQNVINSYSNGKTGQEYKEGDLAVRFPDCAAAGAQACETEAQKYAQQWRLAFKNA